MSTPAPRTAVALTPFTRMDTRNNNITVTADTCSATEPGSGFDMGLWLAPPAQMSPTLPTRCQIVGNSHAMTLGKDFGPSSFGSDWDLMVPNEREIYLNHDDIVIEFSPNMASFSPFIDTGSYRDPKALPEVPIRKESLPNPTQASPPSSQTQVSPLALDITNSARIITSSNTSNILPHSKRQGHETPDVSSFLLEEAGRFRCAFPTCKWHHIGWRRRNHGIEHILKDHFQQRIQCSDCWRTYGRRSELLDHRKRKHPGPGQMPVPELPCLNPACRETFYKKFNLKRHLDRNAVCREVASAFGNKDSE
ncbi:hypothetical protein CPB86DRAFT_784200 [Serendipita vermifera]|nr:hypothetical protein CPB86DRAFT_784200 [Serendipita vermifera]